MGTCCTLLGFHENAPDEWGEIKIKLAEKKAYHCRHCPICIQARAHHHTKRASERLPAIVAAHPDARWLFLTLTVKNPKMENLRDMNKAWCRFKELQDFPASGWLRATEVTKGQDGNPHPHFHILMCVSPDYFRPERFVKKPRWLAMWRESMRDESIMKVDIRVVKPRAGTPMADTLKYVFKYSAKVDEILEDPDFLYGLTDQLHKSRFIASGGILKGIMKKPERVLNQEEVERLIDIEVEADREIDFMKSCGLGVRDYAGEYEEEEGGKKEEAESAPTPMSDEDFASADYLAGCVQRIEEHIEVVRSSETIWAGNIPVLEQGLAIARKELAGFLASVVAKSACEVRIAERKKWIAGRREGRRLRMGAIIDAYLEAKRVEQEASPPRPMHFFSWNRKSQHYTRTLPRELQHQEVVMTNGRRGIYPAHIASRRRVCLVLRVAISR